MKKWQEINLDDETMWPKEAIVKLDDAHCDDRGSIQSLVNFPMKNIGKSINVIRKKIMSRKMAKEIILNFLQNGPIFSALIIKLSLFNRSDIKIFIFIVYRVSIYHESYINRIKFSIYESTFAN